MAPAAPRRAVGDFAAAGLHLGLDLASDASLAAFTTYKLGGPAEWLLTLHTRAQLALGVALAVDHGITPALVVGNGSNLLVGDGGVPGLVIHLAGEFTSLEIADPPTNDSCAVPAVRAGGAVLLPVLARQSAARGWRGLEWCVGIPGSVGGAVRMNAGGHGSQTADWLWRVEIADFETGELASRSVEWCEFRYRHSRLGANELVVFAEFLAVPGDRDEADREIADIVRWRRENQPGGANAGSVFTNPPGDSAGRLIEACGLKGVRRGGAWVSDKHANFIQADPAARASDVRGLIEEVKSIVERECGVSLVPEVRCVGIFD